MFPGEDVYDDEDQYGEDYYDDDDEEDYEDEESFDDDGVFDNIDPEMLEQLKLMIAANQAAGGGGGEDYSMMSSGGGYPDMFSGPPAGLQGAVPDSGFSSVSTYGSGFGGGPSSAFDESQGGFEQTHFAAPSNDLMGAFGGQTGDFQQCGEDDEDSYEYSEEDDDYEEDVAGYASGVQESVAFQLQQTRGDIEELHGGFESGMGAEVAAIQMFNAPGQPTTALDEEEESFTPDEGTEESFEDDDDSNNSHTSSPGEYLKSDISHVVALTQSSSQHKVDKPVVSDSKISGAHIPIDYIPQTPVGKRLASLSPEELSKLFHETFPDVPPAPKPTPQNDKIANFTAPNLKANCAGVQVVSPAVGAEKLLPLLWQGDHASTIVHIKKILVTKVNKCLEFSRSLFFFVLRG